MGNIFECEEGYVLQGIGGLAAYSRQGELLQKFSGAGDHFRNFADAVKARNRAALASEVLDGHLSTALCHLANISYRTGETRVLGGESPFGDFGAGREAWERTAAHLRENGLDLSKVPVRVGKLLTFDPAAEKFVGDPDADRLLAREYRKPFVVPENV
jgi:hypothetical protein